MRSVIVATDSAPAGTVQETLVLFTNVQNFSNTGYTATVHIATTSGSAFADTQLVNLGMQLIKTKCNFETGIEN